MTVTFDPASIKAWLVVTAGGTVYQPCLLYTSMKRTTLATIVAMSAGTMHVLPWGGPTLRAPTALGFGDNPVSFFLPVLPAVLVGLVLDVVLSALLGAREKARLGTVKLTSAEFKMAELTEEEKKLARPCLLYTSSWCSPTPRWWACTT